MESLLFQRTHIYVEKVYRFFLIRLGLHSSPFLPSSQGYVQEEWVYGYGALQKN